MDLTNALRKQIISLKEAKHRRALGLFKAEGTKCVLDTIGHFETEYILATSSWIETYRQKLPNCNIIKCTPADIERMSSFKTAADVIAIYHIPSHDTNITEIGKHLSLALDCIQDPGNLGTIIRTADWFGINNIYCSTTTVDCYSPKVVQATMGAISRIKIHYCDLIDLLAKSECPIYGTFLEGENIYKAPLSENGIIVMGNEGQGISPRIAKLVSQKIHIPSYPAGSETSESLNVATAAAITIAEFRRRN